MHWWERCAILREWSWATLNRLCWLLDRNKAKKRTSVSITWNETFIPADVDTVQVARRDRPTSKSSMIDSFCFLRPNRSSPWSPLQPQAANTQKPASATKDWNKLWWINECICKWMAWKTHYLNSKGLLLSSKRAIKTIQSKSPHKYEMAPHKR